MAHRLAARSLALDRLSRARSVASVAACLTRSLVLSSPPTQTPRSLSKWRTRQHRRRQRRTRSACSRWNRGWTRGTRHHRAGVRGRRAGPGPPAQTDGRERNRHRVVTHEVDEPVAAVDRQLVIVVVQALRCNRPRPTPRCRSIGGSSSTRWPRRCCPPASHPQTRGAHTTHGRARPMTRLCSATRPPSRRRCPPRDARSRSRCPPRDARSRSQAGHAPCGSAAAGRPRADLSRAVSFTVRRPPARRGCRVRAVP